MDEVTTVGLSNEQHGHLTRLKENGVFAELIDGYRFAIALAIAFGAEKSLPSVQGRHTIFNIGTLDPEKDIYNLIRSMGIAEAGEGVYRTAERLAEWGVRELWRLQETHQLSIVNLLAEAEERSKG